MKKVKKFIFMSILAITVLLNNNNILGAENVDKETRADQAFSETVPPYTGSGNSDNATTDNYWRGQYDNYWGIDFQYSDETSGNSSVTRFWPEDKSNANLAGGRNLAEGYKNYTMVDLLNSQYEGYVHLAMEDNDDGGSHTYHVSGRWKEE